MTSYEDIAGRFQGLLIILMDTLTRDELAEVDHFVSAGEYGYALETLVHLLVQEDRKVGADIKESLRHLAAQMDMESKVNGVISSIRET